MRLKVERTNDRVHRRPCPHANEAHQPTHEPSHDTQSSSSFLAAVNSLKHPRSRATRPVVVGASGILKGTFESDVSSLLEIFETVRLSKPMGQTSPQLAPPPHPVMPDASERDADHRPGHDLRQRVVAEVHAARPHRRGHRPHHPRQRCGHRIHRRRRRAAAAAAAAAAASSSDCQSSSAQVQRRERRREAGDDNRSRLTPNA